MPDDQPSRDRPGPVTLHHLLRNATERLASAGLATPRLDAEVLLRHVLGIDRAQLFLLLPDPAGEGLGEALDVLIGRRLAGQPVAYLTGTREFMGLPFRVDPAVLIPRPETELLVEWALDWLNPRERATVVDAGTGSGAIAISLAALAPAGLALTVVATDVSGPALAMARRNAGRHGALVRSRLSFVRGSLLEPIDGPVDLVLANLPYLTPDQVAENPDLAAEPALALAGGADGLDLVRSLIVDLPRVLAARGAARRAAGFELDPSQTETVATLLRAAFPAARVGTISDLAGLPRHVIMD